MVLPDTGTVAQSASVTALTVAKVSSGLPTTTLPVPPTLVKATF